LPGRTLRTVGQSSLHEIGRDGMAPSVSTAPPRTLVLRSCVGGRT